MKVKTRIADAESQMRLLFGVYNEQCKRKIEYTASSVIDGNVVSWIVMGGIELSYMEYQGVWRPMFMCSRYSEECGDDVYFFKKYKSCEKVWRMNEEKLNKYIKSITL
tara:strand:+ start:201 stop:524 length:324 start_codon:yes stop_codon:yes gene_type:complete